MSEAALAPKMGPVTEEEKAAVRAWWATVPPTDVELSESLAADPLPHHLANYVIIRARRAGAKLEDLL